MRALFRSLTPLLAWLAISGPAIPQEVSASMKYRVYVGGLNIGKATVVAQVTDEGYFVGAHAESSGIVGWFFEVDAHASVEGLRPGGEIRPVQFNMSSVTEGRDHFQMTIPFGIDAPSGLEAEPPLRDVHYAVDPTEQTGAFDPLTALVAALMPSEDGQPCNRTLPIFDGRRRFDLVIGVKLREYDRNGYPHVQCEARYVRVGGFKEKHMNRPDIPFKVSFAYTGDGFAKPVRLEGESEFGMVVARVNKY